MGLKREISLQPSMSLWWIDFIQQPSTHAAAPSLPSPAGQAENRQWEFWVDIRTV